MKIAVNPQSLSMEAEAKRSLAAMKRTASAAKKDPALRRRLLLAGGMHTKNGQLKKQFR